MSGNGQAYSIFTSGTYLSKENSTNECMITFPTGNITTTNGLLLAVVYSIIILFILTANIILIYGLIETRQLTARSHKLFLVASCCDLTIGLILLPMQIYILNEKSVKCTHLAIQAMICHFFEVFTALVIFGIGLDRYFLIMKETFYKKHTKKPITVTYLVLVILLSFGMSTYSGYTVKYFNTTNLAFFQITEALLLLLLIISTLLINLTILRYVRKTAKEMRRYSATSKYTTYNGKAQKTVLLIAYTFTCTYLPAIGGFIYGAVKSFNFSVNTSMTNIFYVVTWSTSPIFLNSALNSTIFIYRNSQIRKLLKGKVKPLIDYLSRDKNDNLLCNTEKDITSPPLGDQDLIKIHLTP